MIKHTMRYLVLSGSILLSSLFCQLPILSQENTPAPLPPATQQKILPTSLPLKIIESPTTLPQTLQLQTKVTASQRLTPQDFTYLGALRLPEDGTGRPQTFQYAGSAITFNPRGDAGGASDGFSGSLFVSGHPRLPYGELPDGDQIAEVSIPAPIKGAASPQELNQAAFLQRFQNVAGNAFNGLDEITRLGLLYLDHPLTGPKIHLAWGIHLQGDGSEAVASHAWFDPDLSHPDLAGPWYIGSQSPYSINGYLIQIPEDWSKMHTQGYPIATGRFRDGGWSGMGPTLFAYQPWNANGKPAAAGSHLPEIPLLLYAKSNETDALDQTLKGYQHPDEWEGGAWITTASGKSAVLFAGTKGVGEKYWYGFANPAGPNQPCVEGEMVGQLTICRLANGSLCPEQDLTECAGHNDYRGWWTTRFEAQFILYDPADLAQVTAGALQPWEPQPYATLVIDDQLFKNPAGVEEDMLGRGVQRRFRIGEVGYDRQNGLLYVLELYADETRPVVHVWKVG